MKKIAAAVAAVVCLSLVACGGESSTGTGPYDPAPTPTSSSTETGSPAPADTSAPGPAPSASSSSSSGGSSSGPGACEPDAACNGLSTCSDYSYGPRDCTLHCNCQNDRLLCSMTCS